MIRPAEVTINKITAEFDMTGRCQSCGKRVRRRKKFSASTLVGVRAQSVLYNEQHPFLCRLHKIRP